MIRVQIKLYATLSRYGPAHKAGEVIDMELAEGTTVKALLGERLRLPPDQVRTVFVNNTMRPLDYVLADGDRVGIFPPVAGG